MRQSDASEIFNLEERDKKQTIVGKPQEDKSYIAMGLHERANYLFEQERDTTGVSRNKTIFSQTTSADRFTAVQRVTINAATSGVVEESKLLEQDNNTEKASCWSKIFCCLKPKTKNIER